jgi:TPR repeat protein
MLREEKVMHARVLSLLIASVALSGATEGALAQAAARTYPWCGTNGGGESCYYATLEQCIATTAGGRGGRCVASPYYRRDAAVATRSDGGGAARSERTVAARVADRAAVRPSRAAFVPSVPESRSARSSGAAPLSSSDQLAAQDYATIVGSAEQGDAVAQYNLAVMYDSGRGVLQDYVLAHKWYNLAASHYATWEADIGASAARSRDRLTVRMTPAQIAEAQRMAREWAPKQGR